MSKASEQSLHGRHALVTGASRGLGAAIAAALSNAGADVTLLVRSMTSGADVAKTLPGRAHVVVADLTDTTAINAAIESATTALGPISLCVNNAGIAESAPFLRSDAALWTRTMDVNLMGAVRVTQAVLPAMIEARFGRIVMVASTAGLKGYAYTTAYSASKHALIGLARSLAHEVAAKGITVNAVCPGFSDTGMTDASIARIVQTTGRSEAESRALLVAGNPQRRLVQPHEVASAVCWLCSDGAAAVTGDAIVVAGGELA